MHFEEHRYHSRLQKYWDSLRGSKPFPMEHDINPDELSDIWTSCFLISIDDVTRRTGYRYSYLGDDLVEAYGDDISNPDISQKLLSTAHAPMVKKFDEVMQSKKPITIESEFVNLKKLNIKYRTCILPLGSAGGNVTHLLGCMRWKAY
jgi:hypothetical protein